MFSYSLTADLYHCTHRRPGILAHPTVTVLSKFAGGAVHLCVLDSDSIPTDAFLEN
jgi:hypothetical protein